MTTHKQVKRLMFLIAPLVSPSNLKPLVLLLQTSKKDIAEVRLLGAFALFFKLQIGLYQALLAANGEPSGKAACYYSFIVG